MIQYQVLNQAMSCHVVNQSINKANITNNKNTIPIPQNATTKISATVKYESGLVAS